MTGKYPFLNSFCEGCVQRRLKHYKISGVKSQTKKVPENVFAQSRFVKYLPEYDWEYITDPRNTEEIHRNIQNRKGVGDIHKVV